MRFSVATLLPLAALAVPALSASVQARDDSYGNVDHKGKDGGSKDYNYGNKGKDGGRGDCTWTPVFEHKNDFKGWNKGKYTPYDHKEVNKVTFEIECKSFCEKDDRCNSCQAYSHDEKDDKFVCELFVEIIDIDTWKEDCDDGKDDKDHKDGKKDDKDDKKDDNKKDDRKDDKKDDKKDEKKDDRKDDRKDDKKDDKKDEKKDDRKDDRKDDKKDDKKDDREDDKKYYDTSAWNAHYGY